MSLRNRNGRATALAALLICGAAVLGCETRTPQGDDQGGAVGGTADVPAPNTPTAGQAGTPNTIEGDAATISGRVEVNPTAAPTDTGPGPEAPGSGNLDRVGGAGPVNAQGTAIDVSGSPTQAHAPGTPPVNPGVTEPGADPADDSAVDTQP